MNDLKFTTAGDYMVTDTKFDELMYRAGLTAQGCWDEMDDYDRKAIEKFAELIIKECTNVIEGGRFLHDQAPTALFAKECTGAIKRHFGVKE
jgi:hypothetical protein